jgi:hypothetical protein
MIEEERSESGDVMKNARLAIAFGFAQSLIKESAVTR